MPAALSRLSASIRYSQSCPLKKDTKSGIVQPLKVTHLTCACSISCQCPCGPLSLRPKNFFPTFPSLHNSWHICELHWGCDSISSFPIIFQFFTSLPATQRCPLYLRQSCISPKVFVCFGSLREGGFSEMPREINSFSCKSIHRRLA